MTDSRSTKIAGVRLAALIVILASFGMAVPKFAEAQCGAACGYCWVDETNIVTTYNSAWWPYPYNCAQTECPNQCQPMFGGAWDTEEVLGSEAEVGELLAAVAGDRIAEVSDLIGRYQNVMFNRARSALQVIGTATCTGAPASIVMLHVPLSPIQMAAVEEAESEFARSP
jgi:hypothetical protein